MPSEPSDFERPVLPRQLSLQQSAERAERSEMHEACTLLLSFLRLRTVLAMNEPSEARSARCHSLLFQGFLIVISFRLERSPKLFERGLFLICCNRMPVCVAMLSSQPSDPRRAASLSRLMFVFSAQRRCRHFRARIADPLCLTDFHFTYQMISPPFPDKTLRK